ncbi:phytanoyl-CoA dioxygenase family protein [Hydrogenophaga sp.]|uniref:phytanoyl-CoA dioxygenase family protein n=1 Tax=Hydrogenophaga sp. TaxID=1904254 RepID=UPI003F70BDA7
MATIRQTLLDELKRAAGGKGVPKSVHGLPAFQQIGKLSAMVKVPDLHEALVTPALIETITRLGALPSPPQLQPTQLLLSPPRQGEWTLKGLNWHVDISADPPHRLPGIQAFFLLDDVAPRGGATLALAGSHRPQDHPPGTSAVHAPSLRALLRNTPDPLEPQLLDRGISLVEMCGRAGDVFLMDMRVLHTPSINSTNRLRMMATARAVFGH